MRNDPAKERRDQGMRLMLRDAIEEDLPVFFEHQCDSVAHRMAAFEPRNKTAFMEHWKGNVLADPAVAKKTILLNDRVAGFLVCFERSGKREVGYWIGREFWGQGVASKGLSEFLLQVPQRPLYAVVAKQNVASVRVLQKCGFAVQGASRRAPDKSGPGVEEWTMRLDASEP